MSNYDKQAEAFLEKHGFKLSIKEGEGKCPPWGHEHGCSHGDQYRITLSRKQTLEGRPKRITFNWWGSIAMMQERKNPRAYGILSTLSSDSSSPTDPDEVTQEFGNIPPSQAYAVARFAERLQDFFTEEELTDLREIQ